MKSSHKWSEVPSTEVIRDDDSARFKRLKSIASYRTRLSLELKSLKITNTSVRSYCLSEKRLSLSKVGCTCLPNIVEFFKQKNYSILRGCQTLK